MSPQQLDSLLNFVESMGPRMKATSEVIEAVDNANRKGRGGCTPEHLDRKKAQMAQI